MSPPNQTAGCSGADDSPPLNGAGSWNGSKFDKSVSFLTWAYNEEILIGSFLERINQLLSENIIDYEIIVIDDGSRDRTGAIVRELQKKIPRIKLLTNEKNMDVGYALKRAVAAASKEYLFWQTVDWAYDISLLRYYLELLKYHDVVAGVRYAPVLADGGRLKPIRSLLGVFHPKHLSVRSDNFKKSIISAINYALIRLLFQAPLSDFQNVDFYPTRLAQSLTIESDSNFTNPEFLIQSYWQGASIIEVPISFIPRQAGQGKGTRPRALVRAVSDIFRLWHKWMIRGRKDHPATGRVIHLNRNEWERPMNNRMASLDRGVG